MKPSQLVLTLFRIASNIERSKNPDRTLVARDLKRVVSLLLNEAVKKRKPTIVDMRYDNSDPNMKELVDDVLYAMDDEPIWFSRHDHGWIMSRVDPNTLNPGDSVDGRLWGDIVAEVTDNNPLDFKRCASTSHILHNNDDLLAWMTSGCDGMLCEELMEVFIDHGYTDLVDRLLNSTWP
jgi:hypothetical protein